jgi:ABC-2 type transport system ATP-binding protein
VRRKLTVIKLENVTKKYGKFEALKGISFEVNEGEIVGLLGPNGAGKTTTMNIITGFIEQTSGNVIVDGIDVLKKPSKAKKIIGYMPEGVPLYSDLTVKEFIKYIAELKRVDKKEIKEKVQKALEDVGLLDVQNKLIRNLSRGYKQRVSLAGTLVANPKVIILDEPTVGLDPKQVTEIREVIRKLAKENTVILSSHILSEVSQVCNRVIIMNKGEVVAIDTPENLEQKVSTKNIIYVTVEDTENKVIGMKEKIEGIKDIKLEKTKEDGTKQYIIEAEDNLDIRKTIFASFAKENLTIFEMKKADISLEDAFMKLIEKGEKNESNI